MLDCGPVRIAAFSGEVSYFAATPIFSGRANFASAMIIGRTRGCCSAAAECGKCVRDDVGRMLSSMFSSHEVE